MLLLESECIPLYVLAVTQPVALPDVLKGVQLVVAETQVVHPEVDRRTLPVVASIMSVMILGT